MDGLDVLLGGQAQTNGLDVLMGGNVTTAPAVAPAVAPAAASMPPAQPISRTSRFMKGLNDVSSAGAQLLTHMLPDKVVSAVNDATSYVNGLPMIGPVTQALGMVPASASGLDKNIAESERSYQASRRAAGQTGVDWMRMGGNIVGTAPLAAALPAATSIPAAAGQGAVFGALSQPVTSGNFASEKAKQIGLGMATGGATNLALRGAASLISPTIRPEVKTLMDAGVTPTPGQILGGGASRIEQAMTSIPVLGDMVKNAQRRSVEQLNTAAINRSLDPIGESLPSGKLGRDAIEYAADKLGTAYDDVLAKIGAVKVDNQTVNDLANLSGLVNGLPKAQSEQFGRILDSQILNRIDQNGFITGEALKAAESNLGSLARGYGRSADFDQRQMATAIQEAQSTLRDMLARQAPNYADRLQAINTGYANLLRPQRAAASLAADQGVFTASQLQSAVKALDSSKNKRAFATGKALMQDLSDSGKSVLGPTLPDSGTPFRHAVQVGGAALLGHSMLPESMAGASIPAAGLLGAASVPYTKPGQELSAFLLTRRPDIAKPIAGGLLGLTPVAPLLATPLPQGR